MSSNNSRVVGLDIGGSKTHAVAAGLAADAAQQQVLAGATNLSSVGAAEVTRQLTTVFDGLGRADIETVVAGASGADSQEQQERLGELVRAQVPGAVVQIVHDSQLILAAAGVEHGIAIISGTGSVAWGRTSNGAIARAGGWGYLLGDEGSGYWVGRQAVRLALAQVDRAERPGPLAKQLAAECGLQRPGQLLDHFYTNPERRYWAGHSRLVFELAADGDADAAQLIARAAAALVELVSVVGNVLRLQGPVIFGGGLLVHQPQLQVAVRQGLTATGFRDIRVLDGDPAHGALRLARRLALAGVS